MLQSTRSGGAKKLKAIQGPGEVFKEYRSGAIRKEINRIKEKLKEKDSCTQRGGD